MSFEIQCPQCHRAVVAQDEWIGLECNCPYCSHSFIVSNKKPSNWTQNRMGNMKVAQPVGDHGGPLSQRGTEIKTVQQPIQTEIDYRYISLIDTEEDYDILTSLSAAKKWTHRIGIILCVGLFVGGVFFIVNDNVPLGLCLLGSIPEVIFSISFAIIIISWCRGIYRHSMGASRFCDKK